MQYIKYCFVFFLLIFFYLGKNLENKGRLRNWGSAHRTKLTHTNIILTQISNHKRQSTSAWISNFFLHVFDLEQFSYDRLFSHSLCKCKQRFKALNSPEVGILKVRNDPGKSVSYLTPVDLTFLKTLQ